MPSIGRFDQQPHQMKDGINCQTQLEWSYNELKHCTKMAENYLPALGDLENDEMLEQHLKRMFTEFFAEIKAEGWFGKEREMVSRFAFTKLVKNIGCCNDLYDSGQIGVEVRVNQVIVPGKKEVCKDMVIWKIPNQTAWSKAPVPLWIIEWKHGNKKPSQYDIDWLKKYTGTHPDCLGIALNVESKREYSLEAVLLKQGEIVDANWVCK